MLPWSPQENASNRAPNSQSLGGQTDMPQASRWPSRTEVSRESPPLRFMQPPRFPGLQVTNSSITLPPDRNCLHPNITLSNFSIYTGDSQPAALGHCCTDLCLLSTSRPLGRSPRTDTADCLYTFSSPEYQSPSF